MSKHNSFAIVNGAIITADDGNPTLNSRIVGDVDGAEAVPVAEEMIRRANSQPALLAACEALVERYGPASGYSGEQRNELVAAESAIALAKRA